MEWAGCWYVRLVFCKLCVAYIGQLAIGIVSAVVCGGCSLGWAWNVLKHKLHASPYAQSAMCSVWWLWVRLAMSCVNGKIETCATYTFTARCFRELRKPEHHFYSRFHGVYIQCNSVIACQKLTTPKGVALFICMCRICSRKNYHEYNAGKTTSYKKGAYMFDNKEQLLLSIVINHSSFNNHAFRKHIFAFSVFTREKLSFLICRFQKFSLSEMSSNWKRFHYWFHRCHVNERCICKEMFTF